MFRTQITRIVARRKLEALSIAAVAALAAVGIARPDAPFSEVLTFEPVVAMAPNVAAALDLPDIDHPRVDSWIKRFTNEQRGSFLTYLNRMTRYEDMISSKLAERDMPQDLIFLAMIESGFNPNAQSPVKALGLWQFMSATGKEYGLTISGRMDERRNPERSTDAALTYLSRLHKRFGSWYLAAAAYNTGQGRVARVMKQTLGRERGTDEDFYRIAHRLPRETREYVPKLIAAARIAKNPEKYGLKRG